MWLVFNRLGKSLKRTEVKQKIDRWLKDNPTYIATLAEAAEERRLEILQSAGKSLRERQFILKLIGKYASMWYTQEMSM